MPFNKLEDTPAGQIRPRFRLSTTVPKDEIMSIIESYCQNDDSIKHSKFDRFIKISIPKKEQHYWSPVLSLSFDQEKNQTIIRGLIGPNEKVWTKFMFFYIATATLGLFGSIFSLVYYQLYDSLAYIFIIPLTILLLLSIFLTANYGKKQGHTQMIHLLRALRRAVDGKDCARTI